MKKYLDLCNKVLTTGEIRNDRTGVGTFSLFSESISFNLAEGFPAVTTKKLAFKMVVSELLWFLEGSTDERRLAEIHYGTRDANKTTIWTENANSPYWIDKAKFSGDVGRIYGCQWRTWKTFTDSGIKTTDQVQNLIHSLKNDPYGRRHIISAWNPGELSEMALPPCHIMSQFYVSTKGTLSCSMYQRSQDLLLGAPFNYASYALLTHMLAQICGYSVGTLNVHVGDCHVYQNHVDGLAIQSSRSPYELPTLTMPEFNSIEDLLTTTPDQYKLINYRHHDPIKMKMAV